ncbi:MAG: hypothetical protein NTZ35_00160, partial [Ignavibacteriales bacterium]|nr:hypothetical protein [Ignavibacteriales bacterium]
MAKNYSYQQPANTSSMSSSYSVYNQPQQSNNNQPQQNTSQPQRNNSQQSSYAAPQQQQQAAPLNMAAYSPQPQQAARIPSPGQAQGIEPRSNGTPYMPPGAVRETSDFLAPEVRARLAAPAEPQAGFEPWLNPQPQQSPASGRDAWNQAGRPGWDPNGTYTQDTGTAKDGTAFGLSSEARAYDRWRAGSSGNAQPNPTQPPPNGRYGGPRVDPWVGATPENPAYDPAERAATAERIRQAEQPRFYTPPGVPITAEQSRAVEEVRPFSAPPRPAPQPGQNSYGFRGYDINNGYSIRPEASPANA